MRRILRIAALGVLAFAVFSLAPHTPVLAQTSPGNPAGIQFPAIPDPVAVSLDPSTTAFLALDFMQSNCSAQRPTCIASLPAVASGLTAARAAGVFVVYSQTPGGTIRSEVAPQPGDPIVIAQADKFFNTDLDDILKQAGITTVVITGTSSNGVVLYTAFGASERGYTVVVATDGISAGNDVLNYLALEQMLNEPGFANLPNTPLQPKAVTLSRTDLITYQR